MIVQRVFNRVKAGRTGEFLALAKSNPDSALSLVTRRTYTPHIGPSVHTICHEAEFESLDEMDKVWATWWADPETPAYMEKFWSLVEDAYSEVWNLEE